MTGIAKAFFTQFEDYFAESLFIEQRAHRLFFREHKMAAFIINGNRLAQAFTKRFSHGVIALGRRFIDIDGPQLATCIFTAISFTLKVMIYSRIN